MAAARPLTCVQCGAAINEGFLCALCQTPRAPQVRVRRKPRRVFLKVFMTLIGLLLCGVTFVAIAGSRPGASGLPPEQASSFAPVANTHDQATESTIGQSQSPPNQVAQASPPVAQAPAPYHGPIDVFDKQPATERCPDCGGSGIIIASHEETAPCSHCNGRGWSLDWENHVAKCIFCMGSGTDCKTVNDDHNCRTCGGIGCISAAHLEWTKTHITHP